MIRRISGEAGYSLTEVLAAIVILSIAIIPMVGMFDAGLRAASSSGNFDMARALANQKLEQAKSSSYDTVNASFPNNTCTLTDADTNEKICANQTADVPSGLTSYSVKKRFVSRTLETPSSNVGLMKITVTVSWGTSNSYSTTGVVSR